MSANYGTLHAAIQTATEEKRTVYCSVDAVEYVIRPNGEWWRVGKASGELAPSDLASVGAIVSQSSGFWLGRQLSRDCTNTFHHLCGETTCGCICHDERTRKKCTVVDKQAQGTFDDFGSITV